MDEKKPISEARKKANKKWDKANTSVLSCKVKKEEAEAFKMYSAKLNRTPSSLLLEYVRNCIAQENLNSDKLSVNPEQPETSNTQQRAYTPAKRTVYTLNDMEFHGISELQGYLQSINIIISDNVIMNYVYKGRLSAEVKEKYPILEQIKRAANPEQTNFRW